MQPARSFALVVDEYDSSRPGYPDDAVRWLVGDVPLDVVDLGAGTGKLTRSLSRLGHRVVAVEPLVPMLQRLRDQVPGARPVVGSAEAIPLADGTADAVVVAQAFHWFDAPRALAEIARVLRPGGRVGLIWNQRDETVPWVARLGEVIGAVETLPAGWLDCFRGSAFGAVETARFRHVQEFDADGLCRLAASRSYVASLDEAGRAEVLGRLRELLAEHPDLTGRTTYQLPYDVAVYRAPLVS
ncbi:MAG TPA: methyltransferase domain-containing protein [Mycobacteriales bacterium]|jgi:SAM-dependent methyltransferase|nr:methyltransferase domain-containing protein [Mycobacteriales bacterium]